MGGDFYLDREGIKEFPLGTLLLFAAGRSMNWTPLAFVSLPSSFVLRQKSGTRIRIQNGIYTNRLAPFPSDTPISCLLN